MHQHQRKQDSNDRRRKDMGHKPDKTKQVKYTNRNPLTLPWGVLPPSWTPFFGPCFPCPSVWFLVCSLVPPLFWLLCFVSLCLCFGLLFCGCLLCGLCVPPLVLLGFLFCCDVAPLPRWLLSPCPPSVVPLRRPGPVTVLVPPSGYLVASCDGPVALP